MMPVVAQSPSISRGYNVATQNVEYWAEDTLMKEVPIEVEVYENSKLDGAEQKKANLELQEIMREARKPEE